jgi:hypothetical protein
MDCIECGKKLVSIGNQRKGGKNHCDWATRKLHKCCFIKLNKTYDNLLSMLDMYKSNHFNEIAIKNLETRIINVRTKLK